MSRYLLGLVGFEPSLPLTANQSLTTGPVKHFSASTYSATTNINHVKTSWVVNLFSAFGKLVFVRSLPACSQSKEGGLDCDGWVGEVRTHG